MPCPFGELDAIILWFGPLFEGLSPPTYFTHHHWGNQAEQEYSRFKPADLGDPQGWELLPYSRSDLEYGAGGAPITSGEFVTCCSPSRADL